MIPALKSNAGANNPPEYAPGEQEFNEEEAKNGEPIAPEYRAIAQPLVKVFGESVNRLIFSRDWTLRERGIGEVEGWVVLNKAESRIEPSEAFVASVFLVRHAI